MSWLAGIGLFTAGYLAAMALHLPGFRVRPPTQRRHSADIVPMARRRNAR